VAFFQAARPVEGADPEAPNVPSKPFTRFAIAQDMGGAIQGAHIDVYWGTDDYAQLASNLMNSKGTLFLPRHKPARAR
jgi:membrane-bound lytic murein transglycosylase